MKEIWKWQAVCRNDKCCDGLFFYAVKSTGIFCRPSCKSRAPRRENVVFFDSREEAMEAGFRPCKRCRSQLVEWECGKEEARRLKELLDAGLPEDELAVQINRIGKSFPRLTAVFKKEFGLTPHAYSIKQKCRKACELLLGTDRPIVEIFYAAGFKSSASFYRAFSSETGLTPKEYRQKNL